jgi:hypothetical protein
MLSLLALFIAFTICSQSGFGISQYDLRLQDPHQNALHYTDCTVYYPTGTPAGSQYPLLVFSPGFTESHRFYQYIWTALVPSGYVVTVMSTYDFDPVSFPLWKARDQSFVLGTMDGDDASLFFVFLISSFIFL